MAHVRPGDFWGIPTRRGGVVLLRAGARLLRLDDAALSCRRLVTWGYQVIEGLAHEYFGRHLPEYPEPATERPAGIAG
jgi:hypothetical protein